MAKGEAKTPNPAWTKRLGWGITVTFLVLWAFILGILVGQGSILAPQELQVVQEFLGLGPEPDSEAEPLVQASDQTEMSFYKGTKGAAPPKLPPAKAAPKKPTAQKTAAPKPAKTVQKGWTVQVASFRDQNIALGMVRKLKKDRLPAYVVRSQVKNVGVRFRVRVGPYEDRKQADRMASLIRNQYERAGLVLREK